MHAEKTILDKFCSRLAKLGIDVFGIAQDEAQWITVHPGGRRRRTDGEGQRGGTHVLIDSETGQILGGMGGKHNGKTIAEVKQETKEKKLTQKQVAAISAKEQQKAYGKGFHDGQKSQKQQPEDEYSDNVKKLALALAAYNYAYKNDPASATEKFNEYSELLKSVPSKDAQKWLEMSASDTLKLMKQFSPENAAIKSMQDKTDAALALPPTANNLEAIQNIYGDVQKEMHKLKQEGKTNTPEYEQLEKMNSYLTPHYVKAQEDATKVQEQTNTQQALQNQTQMQANQNEYSPAFIEAAQAKLEAHNAWSELAKGTMTDAEYAVLEKKWYNKLDALPPNEKQTLLDMPMNELETAIQSAQGSQNKYSPAVQQVAKLYWDYDKALDDYHNGKIDKSTLDMFEKSYQNFEQRMSEADKAKWSTIGEKESKEAAAMFTAGAAAGAGEPYKPTAEASALANNVKNYLYSHPLGLSNEAADLAQKWATMHETGITKYFDEAFNFASEATIKEFSKFQDKMLGVQTPSGGNQTSSFEQSLQTSLNVQNIMDKQKDLLAAHQDFYKSVGEKSKGDKFHKLSKEYVSMIDKASSEEISDIAEAMKATASKDVLDVATKGMTAFALSNAWETAKANGDLNYEELEKLYEKAQLAHLDYHTSGMSLGSEDKYKAYLLGNILAKQNPKAGQTQTSGKTAKTTSPYSKELQAAAQASLDYGKALNDYKNKKIDKAAFSAKTKEFKKALQSISIDDANKITVLGNEELQKIVDGQYVSGFTPTSTPANAPQHTGGEYTTPVGELSPIPQNLTWNKSSKYLSSLKGHNFPTADNPTGFNASAKYGKQGFTQAAIPNKADMQSKGFYDTNAAPKGYFADVPHVKNAHPDLEPLNDMIDMPEKEKQFMLDTGKISQDYRERMHNLVPFASQFGSASGRAAAYAYTAQSNTLNRILRGKPIGDDMTYKDEAAQVTQELDKMLSVSRTSEPMTLWRGISSFPGVKNKAEFMKKFAVGKTGEDQGFMSTSIDGNRSAGFAERSEGWGLCKVLAPKGTSAMSMRYQGNGKGFSAFDFEDEILLPRNTKWEVVGYEKGTGFLDDFDYIPIIKIIS